MSHEKFNPYSPGGGLSITEMMHFHLVEMHQLTRNYERMTAWRLDSGDQMS